jgi:hypothetical protein
MELCVLAWGYNPMVKEPDILPEVKPVQFLKMREKEPFDSDH